MNISCFPRCVHVLHQLREWLCHSPWCLLPGQWLLWTGAQSPANLLLFLWEHWACKWSPALYYKLPCLVRYSVSSQKCLNNPCVVCVCRRCWRSLGTCWRWAVRWKPGNVAGSSSGMERSSTTNLLWVWARLLPSKVLLSASKTLHEYFEILCVCVHDGCSWRHEHHLHNSSLPLLST